MFLVRYREAAKLALNSIFSPVLSDYPLTMFITTKPLFILCLAISVLIFLLCFFNYYTLCCLLANVCLTARAHYLGEQYVNQFYNNTQNHLHLVITKHLFTKQLFITILFTLLFTKIITTNRFHTSVSLNYVICILFILYTTYIFTIGTNLILYETTMNKIMSMMLLSLNYEKDLFYYHDDANTR